MPRPSQQWTTYLPFLWKVTAAHETPQSWKRALAHRVLSLLQELTRGFIAVPPLRSASKNYREVIYSRKCYCHSVRTTRALRMQPQRQAFSQLECRQRGAGKREGGRGGKEGKKKKYIKKSHHRRSPLKDIILREVAPGCSPGEKMAC